MDEVQLTEQQKTTVPTEYVGFWKRFLAYWVDGLILGLINIPLSIAFNISYWSQISNPSHPASSATNPAASGIGLLLGITYFVFFWTHENGQTLGHRLLAIRVVKEDGSPMDLGTSVIRYIGYIISSVVLCLGFLWVAWDGKKQGWHDKMARTVVVKTDEKPHTAIAILLFIIPFILFILLMAGLVFLLIFLHAKGLLHNQKTVTPTSVVEVSYSQALFAAANQYRMSHQLPAFAEDDQICSYASKRVDELEKNNGFDDHRGFHEDVANPQLYNAYFNTVGNIIEDYSSTGTAANASMVVQSIAAEKNSALTDPQFTIGCVNSDAKYTVFIMATAPNVSPAIGTYNNQNSYPTAAPNYTPTMSPQSAAQLTQFQQQYNTAQQQIQSGQHP